MSFRKHGIKVVFAAVTCLGLAAMAMGDEEGGKGKGKGKGKPDAAPAATPTVIQLDVSKLPPDLAKALMKYAAAPAGKGAKATEAPSKGKAPAPAAKGKAPAQVAKQLPPGLAKKPANHPGRTHYIQHVLGGKVAGPTGKGVPGKPAAPSKPGKGKQSEEEE
jgi:hypothetical protein